MVVGIGDRGKGMEGGEREGILEEFRGVPGGEGKEGLGVGLCIVGMVVELVEGRIEVESVGGKGSRFRVGVGLLGVEVWEDRGEKYEERERGICWGV